MGDLRIRKSESKCASKVNTLQGMESAKVAADELHCSDTDEWNSTHCGSFKHVNWPLSASDRVSFPPFIRWISDLAVGSHLVWLNQAVTSASVKNMAGLSYIYDLMRKQSNTVQNYCVASFSYKSLYLIICQCCFWSQHRSMQTTQQQQQQHYQQSLCSSAPTLMDPKGGMQKKRAASCCCLVQQSVLFLQTLLIPRGI